MPTANTSFWLPGHHFVNKGDEIPHGHPCIKGREAMFDGVRVEPPAEEAKPVTPKQTKRRATKKAASNG